MEHIILNEGQNRIIEAGSKWWRKKKKQTFEFAGGPGTGKSTIIYHLIKEFNLQQHEILFVTYTGKAALELTRKGCLSRTAHSTLYKIVNIPVLDKNGDPKRKHDRIVTKRGFKKVTEIDEDIRLIVIDEGSMINYEMGKDIVSFGVPVLVTGDLDQLEPLWGKSYFLNNPDGYLTEIMRQKKDDPIIYLSQLAKMGEKIKPGRYGDNALVIRKEDITDQMLLESDINICAKNITRTHMNAYIREKLLNRKKDNLYIGDKVICRKNNRSETVYYMDFDIPLTNGMVGFIEAFDLHSYNIASKNIRVDFRPDFLDAEYTDIDLNLEYLLTEDGLLKDRISNLYYSSGNLFEWGHVITCHLAQGSQYDNILVIDEKMWNKEFQKKWLYTAITRAKEGIVLVV
jgi:exodeoxyribonuclease V